MFASILSQSNLGMLYNIFVCLFVAATSMTVAASIFYKSKDSSQKVKYYMRYFGFAWLMISGMWFANAARTYFTLSEKDNLDEKVFYAVLVLFALQIFFFLMYLLSVLFHKTSLSSMLLFISLLLPSVFMFFVIIDGITFKGVDYWGSAWILPDSARFVLIYSTFSLCIVLIFIIFIRELLYLLFDRLDKFDKKTLYSMIPLGIYFVGILPDILGLFSGWTSVILRTVFIIAAFATYFIYTSEEEVFYDIAGIKEERYFKKILVKRPILLKSAVFVIFTTLLPLIITLALMYYSFIYVINKLQISQIELYSSYLRNQIIIIGVVIGSLTFFVSLVLARLISVRLRTIYKGTREISRENFDYRIENIKGKDEINLMGRLFNTMSDYLKSYREQVEEYSQTLEQQVIDRTAELEEKTKEANSLASQHQNLFNQLKARTDIIMEYMGDGILVLDKKYEIIKVNSFFLSRFGINTQDLLGQNIEKAPVISEYPEFKKMIDTLHEKNLDVYDYKLSLRIPLRGTLECRLSPFENEFGEKGTIIVLREAYQPWGTVIDGTTSEPIKLAVVRLFDETSGQVIDTEVTDPEGRFGFFVNPGSYHVTVMKDGYHFPAKDPAGYHGEVITIKSKEEGAIKFNILMDPVVEDEYAPSVTEKITKPSKKFQEKKDKEIQDSAVLKTVSQFESEKEEKKSV